MTREVGWYVEGCDLCQRMKNKTKEVVGKLKLEEVLEKPWTHILVDFITKLLIVAEKDAILVVCDRLSKITHFITIIEGMMAKGLARLFRDSVEVAWLTRECSVRQGTAVCCRINQGVEQNVGYPDEIVNCFLSSN